MKKVLAILLSVALLISVIALSGCSKGGGEKSGEKKNETAAEEIAVPDGYSKLTISGGNYGVNCQLLVPKLTGWELEDLNTRSKTITAKNVGGENGWDIGLDVVVSAMEKSAYEDDLKKPTESPDYYKSVACKNGVECVRYNQAFSTELTFYAGNYLGGKMCVEVVIYNAKIGTDKVNEHAETEEIIKSLADSITITDETGGKGYTGNDIFDRVGSVSFAPEIQYDGTAVPAKVSLFGVGTEALRDVNYTVNDANGKYVKFSIDEIEYVESNKFEDAISTEGDSAFTKDKAGDYEGYGRQIDRGNMEQYYDFCYTPGNSYYYTFRIYIEDPKADTETAKKLIAAVISSAKFRMGTDEDKFNAVTGTLE